jgi:hypothetical protein
MKKITVIGLSMILIMSCSGKIQKSEDAGQIPCTDVSVTTVSFGHIDKEIELSAVTAFLRKNIVTAPNSSFITACYVQPGTIVHRGQLLYKLESKERKALGGDMMGSNMGMVNINASVSGVVTEVQQQSGGYVTEGSSLCSIANTGSMVFEVEVPTEDMKYIKEGTFCLILLPDGRKITAELSTPLATMDVNAQVQLVPAHAKISSLPEGLRAKAILRPMSSNKGAQILPKAAVQSDENMTSFWIMKVSNGRALKIPVTIGNSNNTEMEITSPSLTTSDKIVTTGSYLLQNGDKVKIVNYSR